MRMRGIIALTCIMVATQTASGEAQRTRDRARLVFSVSGAYIEGKGLWSVPNQPILGATPADTLVLGRSIKSTIGASFSGTYFPGETFGLTADASLIGLGYDDRCEVAALSTASAAQICNSIANQDRSAAAASLSVGGEVRVLSREFFSPFARASAGLLFSNQSSTAVGGSDEQGAFLQIYEDDKQARVSPTFALGVGTTIALARAYHLRWEVRDNIVGVQRVTGAAPGQGFIPPRETIYKHLISLLVGVNVILERERGRRY